MARPKVYEEERVTTAVRLPKSSHEQLRAEARERDVSVNYLIVRAVERYVNDLPPLERSTPE
jgi:predicted HicB family RNase H-like nuclease